MKTIYLALLVLIFACDSKSKPDCGIPAPKTTTDILTGSWSLRTYTQGLAQPENFNTNDVVYKFNPENNVVVTINTALPANTRLPIQTNSNLSYSLLNNIDLTILNNAYKVVIQNGNKLILDQNSASDGPRLIFDKI